MMMHVSAPSNYDDIDDVIMAIMMMHVTVPCDNVDEVRLRLQQLQQQVLMKERLQSSFNLCQLVVDTRSKKLLNTGLQYPSHQSYQAACTCPCALDHSSLSGPGSCTLARGPGLQWPAGNHPLCSQDRSESASSARPGREVTETFACLRFCQFTFLPVCLLSASCTCQTFL